MPMEKKKKKKGHHKVAQEPHTSATILSKEDQSRPIVVHFTHATQIDSPSNDNVPSLNHQYPSTLQWPYMPQSPLPGVINQWQQFPHLQQNPSNHQVQQGQLPRNYTQSAAPLWLAQRPGYPLPGVNAPANFPPYIALGATDTSWQSPAAVGGGTSTTNQAQVPNFCYPVGYTYPGYPGPCDPSWWGQAQQPLCTYAFPGGYFPSPPASLPDCTASLGLSCQKGIIRPPAKLSEKHQKLWDAQSAENVQLWNVVNHLQSEITDYKNRLVRLEAEVSSLKPAVEETAAQVRGAVLSRQPSKRGRPKRSAASVDALPSPGESDRRTQGIKPAACKVNQLDAKPHVFENVILNKVEDKEKAYHSAATSEQGNNTSNMVPHSGGSMEINGSNSAMPAFNYQFQQEHPNAQICGMGRTASIELKASDAKANYSVISQLANGTNTQANLALHMGAIGTGSVGWPSSITSETEGNELHIASQGFYSSGSVIRRGGKVIPGWSFVNEEDASEKLEDAAGSGKDDSEENMDNNSSSGAEDIARTKDESAIEHGW